MNDTHPRPPLTRGLSAEQADWGREMLFSFLSLRLPFGQTPPSSEGALSCSFQHILNEYTVSSLRIIYQNMGHSTNKFPILYKGTAGHECVKCRTKLFSIFSDIFLKYVEKTSMRVEEPINTT